MGDGATIDFEFEDKVDIDEFDEGWEVPLAIGSVWKDGEGGLIDTFNLSHRYVPIEGKYVGSILNIHVSTASTHRSIPTKILDSVATMEFTAKVIGSDSDQYHSCHLLEKDTENVHGMLSMHPEYVPADCRTGDGTYSIAIQIEYEHELTKKERGYSDEKIGNRRDSGHETIEYLRDTPQWEE